MKLITAVKHMRRLLDDYGGHGIDWTDLTEADADSQQLRWTNEELTDYLNEAQKQAARRSLLLKDGTGDYDITLVADDPNYDLDPLVIRVKNARLQSTGDPLTISEIEDVWHDTEFATRATKPTDIIVDYTSNTLRVYPMPDDNYNGDVINLLVYRLPLDDLNWTYNQEEFELREEVMYDAINYALFLAYNKDEANALDPKRAEMFLTLFNQKFSDTSAYSETRKRRTRHRGITYGGL